METGGTIIAQVKYKGKNMRQTRIALAQICPEPGRTEQNLQLILDFLKDASEKRAELVLFPECALTGYNTEMPGEYAIAEDAPVLERIRRESRELKTAVCFGYIERARAGLFLTQELVGEKESIVYRKTHLGKKERQVFQAGDSFPVMKAPLCSGIQLCWESHIPEISAEERKKGAELLLVPYAYPASGKDCLENWNIHLPARASDQGCFLAACNLLYKGEGGRNRGGGMAVYDFKGRLIASYFGTEEHLMICDLQGILPREAEAEDMHNISYFDRKRTELFHI